MTRTMTRTFHNQKTTKNRCDAIDAHFGIPLPLKKGAKFAWYAHPDSTVDLACIILDPTYKWPLKKWPILPYSIFAKEIDYYEGKETRLLFQG